MLQLHTTSLLAYYHPSLHHNKLSFSILLYDVGISSNKNFSSYPLVSPLCGSFRVEIEDGYGYSRSCNDNNGSRGESLEDSRLASYLPNLFDEKLSSSIWL